MRKYQLGIVALLMVGLLAGGVFAFGRGNGDVLNAIQADNYDAFVSATGRNVTKEQFSSLVDRSKYASARDAMQKAQAAIKSNDYAAWRSAMSGVSDTSYLTQEQFNALVQRYQVRQKVQQAIASNDFASWKQGMNDMLDLQKAQITQEHFDSIVQRGDQMQHHLFGRAR